jgi:AcrR family transcriptional regulator
MGTKEQILASSSQLMATYGYEGLSMRALGELAGIKQSVVYYYFPSKEELLRSTRINLNKQLDEGIKSLKPTKTVSEMMYQRIMFQLDHRQEIVALLQYFMGAKGDFPGTPSGHVPERAYAHMKEVIERGVAEGNYHSANPTLDAKIMTHAINGFLLEYSADESNTREDQHIAHQLTDFFERALTQERR